MRCPAWSSPSQGLVSGVTNRWQATNRCWSLIIFASGTWIVTAEHAWSVVTFLCMLLDKQKTRHSLHIKGMANAYPQLASAQATRLGCQTWTCNSLPYRPSSLLHGRPHPRQRNVEERGEGEQRERKQKRTESDELCTSNIQMLLDGKERYLCRKK
jgi:hypothetical protein